MEIGKLNKRLTIRNYGAGTPTEYGGVFKGAAVDYETWGSAIRLSQSERLANGLKIGEAAYKFKLRYQAGVTVTQRSEIIYLGETFRVSSITDINEAHFYVELIATERTN